ncbi:MAG: hypothetical protein ABI663_05675 [Chryseolinea sp.]
MESSEKWRPDFIVAVLAVVIGLCTMFVYIYQAKVMSKQLHSSVWPFVEIISSNGSSGINIKVVNKGVGPAIIKKHRIILDGVEYKETAIDTILFKLVGRNLNRDISAVQSRVLASGEKISLLEITSPRDAISLDSAIRKHTFNIELCYCSIYDDCWTSKKGKTESCDSCE